MLFIYRIFVNLIFFLSPFIIAYRILKKKEHFIRFKEKLSFYQKKRVEGKLIWLHGSSVGEILSAIPLIEKLEKKKTIKQILLTSNTLSSSKVIEKLRLKKTIHQFFPLDVNFVTKKFLSYWKPSLAIFLESEIWPNMILNIKNNKIPLILLNARITKKSFKNWKKIINFSKFIFKKFDLSLVQNDETKNYLKTLGAKNIKKIGNLKFSQRNIKTSDKINKNQRIFFNSKKIFFCAASTHPTEEIFCAKIYKKLLKNFNQGIIVIIPRHINRSENIKNKLEEMNFIVHQHSSKSRIKKNTNIYLVDTYGETESFLKLSKVVFLGGSLIPHGGQNPLEAARLGCKILHGSNISNFIEVYSLLRKNNISQKIESVSEAKKMIIKSLKSKSNKKIEKKLKIIGNEILKKNEKELQKYFK